MNIKKTIIFPVIFILGLMIGGVACTTTPEGKGLKAIEQMSDAEYSKWKIYIELIVKVGINKLVDQHVVTTEDLVKVANVIESIEISDIQTGAKSLIKPALEKAGLKNDEIELILLVAEQELISHGALSWTNPETGMIELSPRTKEILAIIVNVLRNSEPTATK